MNFMTSQSARFGPQAHLLSRFPSDVLFLRLLGLQLKNE